MNLRTQPRSTPSVVASSANSPADSQRPGRRRLGVNISPAERAGRVVLGVAATIAGVVLLTSAGSVLAVLLELLLVAASLDLVVTGAIGHCPIYRQLGHVPRSLRSPT
jgi:hypothetical protein